MLCNSFCLFLLLSSVFALFGYIIFFFWNSKNKGGGVSNPHPILSGSANKYYQIHGSNNYVQTTIVVNSDKHSIIYAIFNNWSITEKNNQQHMKYRVQIHFNFLSRSKE